MKRFRAAASLCVVLVSLMLAQKSEASNITLLGTAFNTDVAYAGYGGMRGIGTGTLTVTGVSGPVTQALLYWQGPTNSSDATANASVTFAGTPVTGTNIGFSSDNCWGFANSQAYRADVTSLVTGNGSYSLANFRKPGIDINGVSLVIFFDDGNPTNNRDVVVFDGNDSNIPNSFDANGWNVTLAGINYTSGTASLDLHVSDGQTFPDAALILNGNTLVPAGPIFQGNSVPGGPGGPSNGFLWDIKSFNVTSFLSPGTNTLTLTTGVNSDCLSLIVAAVNLPAGAAPGGPVAEGYAARIRVNSPAVETGKVARAFIDKGGASDDKAIVSQGVPGTATVAVGHSTAQGDAGSISAGATGSSALVDVDVMGGLVHADAVKAVAHAEHNVFSGNTTSSNGSGFVNLSVMNSPMSDSVPANTMVPIPGVGTVILREEVATANSTSVTLQVNMIHFLSSDGSVEIVVSSAFAGAGLNIVPPEDVQSSLPVQLP